MQLWILLIIVLLLIGFVILLRVLRSVVSAALSILGLAIILFLIVGIVLYVDGSNLKESFEGDKVLLLTKDGAVKAGLRVNNLDSVTTRNMDYLGAEEISNANMLFQDEEYDELRDDNDFLMIFRYKAFNGTGGMELEDVTISYEEIGLILEEDNLYDAFMIIMEDERLTSSEKELKMVELEEEFGSIEALKAALLMFLFGDRVKEEGLRFIVDNYKEENIIVRPEFITMKILDRIPRFMKNNFFGGDI